MSKLFDNTVSLKFKEEDGVETKTAISMFSGDGEEVPLTPPCNCEGPVSCYKDDFFVFVIYFENL